MRDLFGYITKHRAQTIILDYKLKPFIPDYIPAVGDIDAFLKVEVPFHLKKLSPDKTRTQVLELGPRDGSLVWSGLVMR